MQGQERGPRKQVNDFFVHKLKVGAHILTEGKSGTKNISSRYEALSG